MDAASITVHPKGVGLVRVLACVRASQVLQHLDGKSAVLLKRESPVFHPISWSNNTGGSENGYVF